MGSRRCRRVLTVLVSAGLCAVAVQGPTATAAPGLAECSSPNPVYDAYLTAAMESAVAASEGAAIGLYDRKTDTTCYHQPDQKFNTASVVKVLIATALQWRAQQESRPLTPEEDTWAREMITSGDDGVSNRAASELWSQLRLHGPYVDEVVSALGLADTRPADDGGWGMTETTARDQVKLLSFLTSPGAEFLDLERREYVLQRMTEIPLKHRWGVPVGAPTSWYNKIGYAKLDGGLLGYLNYRTHSVGAVRGGFGDLEFDYVLVILSDGNIPLRGIPRVSAAALAINQAKLANPQ